MSEKKTEEECQQAELNELFQKSFEAAAQVGEALKHNQEFSLELRAQMKELGAKLAENEEFSGGLFDEMRHENVAEYLKKKREYGHEKYLTAEEIHAEVQREELSAHIAHTAHSLTEKAETYAKASERLKNIEEERLSNEEKKSLQRELDAQKQELMTESLEMKRKQGLAEEKLFHALEEKIESKSEPEPVAHAPVPQPTPYGNSGHGGEAEE